MIVLPKKITPRGWRGAFSESLAAAAAVVAVIAAAVTAAVVAAAVVATAVIAATATATATAVAVEQEQQNDHNDEPIAVTTEAGILITHSVTSYEILPRQRGLIP